MDNRLEFLKKLLARYGFISDLLIVSLYLLLHSLYRAQTRTTLTAFFRARFHVLILWSRAQVSPFYIRLRVCLSTNHILLILALEVERTALLLICTKDDISGYWEFNYSKLRVVKTCVNLYVYIVLVLYFKQVASGYGFESLVIP